MAGGACARAAAVLVLALQVSRAACFSTFAGSCKHAGVNHGLDKFVAQDGDGGHALALSAPGVNVGGATVTVTLSGTEDYKGLLLFAEVDGRPAGAWGADLPEGVQPHPHCKLTVTHDTYHVGGKQRDDIPWVVPEGLSEGSSVVFKATVVRDYATWFAFERAFVVGSEDGAGGTPALLATDADTRARADGSAATPEAAAPEPAGGAEAPEDADDTSTEQSSQQLELAAFKARRRQLRLLHGALMSTAWLIAAPAGALAARYFKFLGALWFDAHRLLQGITVGATLFGGAIAFGILHPRLSGMGPHGKLGTVVLLLTCVQPVVAVFRPAKTAGKPRAAWKQLHAGLGWASVALGAANCVVGARLMVLFEHDSAARWYLVLLLMALVPLIGAAYVAQTRRRSVLPFSFQAKSREH